MTATTAKNQGIFLVNPSIVHRSPESQMSVWAEECLAWPPKFRATLLWDAKVTIKYKSLLECSLNNNNNDNDDDDGHHHHEENGTTKQITFQRELSQCTQHEMDHNRGVIIADHISLNELLLTFDLKSKQQLLSLLSFDMANIENADGLHPKRMERAYLQYSRDSALLPPNDRYLTLAMEDKRGYGKRVVVTTTSSS